MTLYVETNCRYMHLLFIHMNVTQKTMLALVIEYKCYAKFLSSHLHMVVF